MPVALILGIIQGAIAAEPWVETLVKQLHGKTTVTAAELEQEMEAARAVHARIQES